MSIRYNTRAASRRAGQMTRSDAASPADRRARDPSPAEEARTSHIASVSSRSLSLTPEVESNPVGYASPAFLASQVPPSEPDDFAHYRFFILPIPPCTELAPVDVLYELQPPQSPGFTMLLIVRWTNPDRAPVLPEVLDLRPLVLTKVPAERFAFALEIAQNVPPLLVDPITGHRLI